MRATSSATFCPWSSSKGETEIDSGSHPCGAVDVAVTYPNRVAVDRDFWKASGEFVHERPVSRRSFTIKKASLSQDVGPRTNRPHPTAFARPCSKPPQERRGKLDLLRLDAGNQQGVDLALQCRVMTCAGKLQPAHALDRSVGVGGDQLQMIVPI